MSVRRRKSPVSIGLPAVLVALACALLAPSIAGADVDATGRLEKISSPLKSSLGAIQPLATSANGDYRCADKYSAVENWYYYFALGNCKQGWEIQVVSYASENSVTHEHSYGGFVTGAFSGCGWIDTRFPLEKLNSNHNSACGEGSGSEFKVEESTFMAKHNGGSTGDGYPTVNRTACLEYANYRPWSSSNVEQELIRTAPAYATSGAGSNYPALKWRYTTKYNSTDGSGQYVMVRDDRVTGAGEANWVFVPRSCPPATLPENENERVPSPPTVTTGGTSGVEPQGATLHGTVNPNTVDAKYHFEYWTTGSPASTPEGDAGSGNGGVEESASIGGLIPGTTYHYRLVATSATGTGTGGEATFTTPGPVEAVTEGATGVQEEQVTLNGTVNPHSYEAKYYFQYGETSTYGMATTEDNTGAGATPQQENSTVTGLQPGLTYHYRIVAMGGGITSYGADQAFVTYSAPSEVVVPAENAIFDSVEGPDHTLNVFVRPTNGVWLGPYEQAGPESTYSAPSQTVETKTGYLYESNEGPNHTLNALVRDPAGVWHGPYTVGGAESTYSAPSEVFESAGDLFDSTVGPSQTLRAPNRR